MINTNPVFTINVLLNYALSELKHQCQHFIMHEKSSQSHYIISALARQISEHVSDTQ